MSFFYTMESETITHFPLNWAPQKLVAKISEKAFLEKLIKSREKAAGEFLGGCHHSAKEILKHSAFSGTQS